MTATKCRLSKEGEDGHSMTQKEQDEGAQEVLRSENLTVLFRLMSKRRIVR